MKTEPRKVERQVERDRILDADRAVKELLHKKDIIKGYFNVKH